MSRVFAVVVILCVALTAAARDDGMRDALLAPLPIRDQFLLSNGFFFFAPETARVLGDGVWSFSAQTTDANTFAKSGWISRSLEGHTGRAKALDTLADSRFQSADTLFLVDGETHRTDLSLRRGFGSNVELAFSLPVTSTGGGWSDRLIENAHRLMKIGDAQRESLRRNYETVYLRHDGTTYIRARGNGFAIGDPAISAKYELAPMEDPKLKVAVVGALELPLGDPRTLDGSGSLDGGLEVLASREFDDSSIHVSTGILRLGANRALGIQPQLLLSNTVALTHRIDAVSAVALQLTVSESPFRQLSVAEFSRRSYQLAAGVTRQIGTLLVHAAFIENVVTFENSADAAFAWGVSRRF